MAANHGQNQLRDRKGLKPSMCRDVMNKLCGQSQLLMLGNGGKNTLMKTVQNRMINLLDTFCSMKCSVKTTKENGIMHQISNKNLYIPSCIGFIVEYIDCADKVGHRHNKLEISRTESDKH